VRREETLKRELQPTKMFHSVACYVLQFLIQEWSMLLERFQHVVNPLGRTYHEISTGRQGLKKIVDHDLL